MPFYSQTVSRKERGRRGEEVSQECFDLLSVLKCLSERRAKKNKVQRSEQRGAPVTAVEHVERRPPRAGGRGRGRKREASPRCRQPHACLCRSATRHPFCCLPSAGLKSVGSFIQAGQAGPGLAGELREGMGKWERAEPRATSGGEHTRVSTNLVTVPTGL